ncbi:hypothetical protein [Marinospirillum sp.]|uniref:hypothetical protein n=1 Tax=Marinospirillum sp. TaxID=2183934 RepID=UPI00384F2565
MNYDEFPEMTRGYLVVPEPNYLPEGHDDIYERFCCAIYMAACINSKTSLYIMPPYSASKAYLRASLAEFVSIEDALKLKCPAVYEDFSIVKSSNPLFHIMKLLRDYNIHLGVTTLLESEIPVALEAKPEEVHDIDTLIVNNLEVNSLMMLRNSKHYSDSELINMVDCFNIQQRRFGVADLIIRGLVMYSSHIKKILTKQSTGSSLR